MTTQFNVKKGLKEAKILAIDDDEWFLRLLIKKFEDVDPGFKITPVNTPLEAIQILEKETFDCILCDHKLPGTINIRGKLFPADGIHLMRKFNEELKIDIPVIFVTGQGSEEIASQALLQGASGYFIKRVQPGYYSLMATSIRQTIDRYWIQRELQKSESRYRDLFENSAGLIFIFDKKGKLQEYNKNFNSVFGYSLEEGKNLTYDQLAYPSDLEKWQEMMNSIYEGSSDTHMLRSLTKDKKILHLDITARPIYGKGTNKIIGVQAIARDITHQVKTQQALIDSEEKHRKVVEGTDDGIIIMDSKGTVLDWNQAAVTITGILKESTVNKSIWEVFKELNPSIMDDNFLDIGKNIDPYAIYQKLLLPEDYSKIPRKFDVTVQNLMDKSYHFLETVLFTIEHSKGNRIALILRDLTEKKKVENEKKAYAKRFQTLIEQTAIGVWITDVPNEKTTYVNDGVAQLLGYSAHEMIGVSALDFVTPDCVEKLKEITRKRLAGEPTDDTYELTFFHRSGKKIFTLITAAAILDEKGTPQETYGFIRDITREKEREAELKTTQDFLESIIASIPSGLYTYDLNQRLTMANPRLAEILGYKSVNKLIGKSLYDLFPKSEHEYIKELVKERLEGKKSDRLLHLSYMTAQGEEVKASVSSVPLIVDNNVDGALVTVTDITEQRRIEKYLHQVQNEYDTLLNNMPLGMIKIDNLGHIISYNFKAKEQLSFTGITDLKSTNILQNQILKEIGLTTKFRDLIYQKSIINKGVISTNFTDNDDNKYCLNFYPIPIADMVHPRISSWILLIRVDQNINE